MAVKTKVKTPEVGIMFRAPQELRGAVRSIAAWAEMSDFRINGKVPLEKDIWAWMAASLYKSGPEKWGELLSSGSEAFKTMKQLTIPSEN